MRERDLDVLLAAQLFASEALRALFLHRVAPGMPESRALRHRLDNCRVSVSTDAGETDLLFVVRLEALGGRRRAILVEDKIDAPLQPLQAERYHQRGTQGIRDGEWDDYRTCLVAPAIRSAEITGMGGWDGCVTLQDIAAWARAAGGPQEVFLANACEQAVAEQMASKGKVSCKATKFWKHYRAAAATELPQLPISGFGESVTRASPWPGFGAGTLPPGVLLQHKPQQGRVDLTVSGQKKDRLQQAMMGRLPLGVVVATAGQSAALRMAVPPVDHLRPFEAQEEEVLAAFAAVKSLYEMGRSLPPDALVLKQPLQPDAKPSCEPIAVGWDRPEA